MIERNQGSRTAMLWIFAGISLLIYGIYAIVSQFKDGSENWYYWLGLLLVGDVLLIIGIRKLSRKKNTK